MNKINKAFTLIELLIVVAIIGVIAGVGIPMYNGYMAKAKVESSRANYASAKNFIANSFAKCAAGSDRIVLPNYKTLSCNDSVLQLNDKFADYFNYHAGFKNPYGSKNHAVTLDTSYFKKTGQCLWLGSICIYAEGNKIHIGINVGDESGGNVFLKDTLVKE